MKAVSEAHSSVLDIVANSFSDSGMSAAVKESIGAGSIR
jgi:hypothetical protein